MTTGPCTGCAGCVVTCPHDVIGYEHKEGGGSTYEFRLEEELGLDNCIHGENGYTGGMSVTVTDRLRTTV